MHRRLFGTDGIRGVANRPPLVPSTVAALGEVLGRLSLEAGAARVIVGRDTRRSGEMLQNALVAGVCAAGANPWLVGILPTPAVAYLTRVLGAELGVVLSASHNPFADNGIKLFTRDGTKAPDALERRIEQELEEAGRALPSSRPIGRDVGSVTFLVDASERYLRGLARFLPSGTWLKGTRVVIDAANGAAFEVAPQAFSAAGASVYPVGTTPDGTNINEGCGATHPELVRSETLRTCSDVGIALDGDADRVVLVDEQGHLLDGDDLLFIFARYGKAMELIHSPVVVGTVMSNLGLERALQAVGMRFVRAGVGDRQVSEAMAREGSDLGGEPSGHIVLRRRATTGDGLLAALTALELARRVGSPLSELRRGFDRLPQRMRSVPVARYAPLETIDAFQQCLQAATVSLGERGRVLVRYSGTEPVVRVMVEAEDLEQAERWLNELVASLQKSLGA